MRDKCWVTNTTRAALALAGTFNEPWGFEDCVAENVAAFHIELSNRIMILHNSLPSNRSTGIYYSLKAPSFMDSATPLLYGNPLPSLYLWLFHFLICVSFFYITEHISVCYKSYLCIFTVSTCPQFQLNSLRMVTIWVSLWHELPTPGLIYLFTVWTSHSPEVTSHLCRQRRPCQKVLLAYKCLATTLPALGVGRG